jgi:hypothetical protein
MECNLIVLCLVYDRQTLQASHARGDGGGDDFIIIIIKKRRAARLARAREGQRFLAD